MSAVLVTGSSGTVGSALRHGLPAHGHTLRLLDRLPPEDPVPGQQQLVGDVSDAAVLHRALVGVDAVVHLATAAGETTLAEAMASHVVGTGRVLDAARAAGVRRVVCASSNHAAGFTPRTPPGTLLGVGGPPRPDTNYGVGKAGIEALASLYADRYGMDVVCLRIGTYRERPVTRRHLSTWLSPGDCARLVHAALTAPSPGCVVVWGTSANTRGWWDLSTARALGYRPEDDAESFAAEIESVPESDVDVAESRAVGGSFTSSAYDHPR